MAYIQELQSATKKNIAKLISNNKNSLTCLSPIPINTFIKTEILRELSIEYIPKLFTPEIWKSMLIPVLSSN